MLNYQFKFTAWYKHIVKWTTGIDTTKGTSGGVTVSKLDYQTYTSEFESHWAPHSFGLVPQRSKELRKITGIDTTKGREKIWPGQ